MRDYRSEIELALAGGAPAIVPFSFYDLLIPEGVDLAPLRAKGLANSARRDVVTCVMPDVVTREIDEGHGRIRTVHDTPVGSVTEVWQRDAYGALSPLEHPIKRREDYRVAEFMAGNARYVPRYDYFQTEREKVGTSGYTLAHCGYSPLECIQIKWIGQEQFCFELADNEDAVMSLYEKLVASQRQFYPLIANSPAQHCLYGGNIVPNMLRPDRVRKYILPCWQEFADIMAERGKTVGCHLDAENKLIRDVIAESRLGLIEAFTPPPDCSITVAEARKLWPDKALWINFPASVLVRSDEDIRRVALEILEQAGDRRGFLMGVTEDVPAEHLVRALSAVLDAINDYCRG